MLNKASLMKALVIGTGSIGRRHISNLLSCGVDVSAYSYRISSGEHNQLPSSVSQVDNLDAGTLRNFDAVIIANRTDLHVVTALSALEHVSSVFIEKPLSCNFDGVDQLILLERQLGRNTEAGFMLRFHPNLIWIKNYFSRQSLGEIMYVNASVGQYLPDWRPESDHKLGYGAKRKYGGGVIFDLIHELDLMYWLCGEVAEVSAMTRYVESLEIETEAIAEIFLRLKSGVLARVHLDYVRPSYERRLEIVGTNGILGWNYMSGEVTLLTRDGAQEVVNRVPSSFDRNCMFRDHLKHFIDRHNNSQVAPQSSLSDAAAVMRIALAAHKSAEDRRFIRPEDIDTNYKVKGL
jgi:predicted dehydrogenase